MAFFRKMLTTEFITYLVVGGLTAVIYFGFIALSIEFFGLDYRIAVTIAYVLAVSFHFLANRKFTFRVVDSRLLHQSIRYLGILGVNYLITLGVVSFLVVRLGVSTYLSAAASIMVTVCIGYVATKFWVFRHKEILHG